MKRLVFLLIAAVALAIPAMATARQHRTLSLSVSPATVITGDTLTLTGSLLDEHYIKGVPVTLSMWNSSDPPVAIWKHPQVKTTDGTGHFSIPVSTTGLAPGVYTFKAITRGAPSASVSVTVTDEVAPLVVAPAPAGIFLCYSTYQTQPGVWPANEAVDLYKGGYWQPFAVPGAVTGGTNLGDYHLTCNLATGQSLPAVHGYLGGSPGEVYGADLHDAYASTLGMYPIIG